MIMDIGRIPINEEKHHYFHYLENLNDQGKSYKRCLAAIVPIFGNLGLGIYDYRKGKSESEVSGRPASPVLEDPSPESPRISPLPSPSPSPSSSPRSSPVSSDSEGSSDESGVEPSSASSSVSTGESSAVEGDKAEVVAPRTRREKAQGIATKTKARAKKAVTKKKKAKTESTAPKGKKVPSKAAAFFSNRKKRERKAAKEVG